MMVRLVELEHTLAASVRDWDIASEQGRHLSEVTFSPGALGDVSPFAVGDYIMFEAADKNERRRRREGIVTVGVFRLRWQRIPAPQRAIDRWRRWYTMEIVATPWPDVRGWFQAIGRTPQSAAASLTRLLNALVEARAVLPLLENDPAAQARVARRLMAEED